MNHRGRPSSACSPCRARRIKCDKAKPTCSQCVRVGNACTGYRNPLDQMFRDESDSVIRRAQKSDHKPPNAGHLVEFTNHQRQRTCSPEDASSSNPSISSSSSNPQPTLTLQPAPATPVEDIALTHFMSSFTPGSRFGYLSQLYPQTSTNSALHASVRAASMAFLSQDVGPIVPQRCYTEALNATNAALSDASTTTKDATLASILLLCLFETLMWMPSCTPRSYRAHGQGAVALIKLRGAQQLQTAVGRNLFRQVYNMIFVNSVRDRTPPPPELVTLLHLVTQHEGETPSYRLACLTKDVSHHMATIAKGGMDAQQALGILHDLDKGFTDFMQELAFEVPYQTFPVEESQDEVYGHSYHVYGTHYEAQMWNSARMIRILLNETIYKQAQRLDPSLSRPIHAQAIRDMDEMVVGICDSVPRSVSCPQSLAVANSGRPFSLKPSIATFLLPLSVVYESDFTTEALHAYIVEQLKFLGGETSVSTTQKTAIQNCSLEAFQNRLYMLYTL